jgi:N-acyl homoserine lactone hydrolase
MAPSAVRKLAVILCGYEFIPHAVSYHGGGHRFWHAVPVCCYLMDTERGFVVVEGGLDEQKLRDAESRSKYFPQNPGYPTPW